MACLKQTAHVHRRCLHARMGEVVMLGSWYMLGSWSLYMPIAPACIVHAGFLQTSSTPAWTLWLAVFNVYRSKGGQVGM